MINVTFPCWASAGKCDETYWERDVEVSDEEYARLKKAFETGVRFIDCSEVSDIYDRLLNEMLKQEAAVYLKDKSLLEGIAEDLFEDMDLEDGDVITEELVVDYLNEAYIWHIEFPDEL